MRIGRMNVIFGGQAGSEAKGKQAAYLVDKYDVRHVACNLSPNAGHTVVRGDGTTHVTHHLPVGMYGSRRPDKVKVYVGPAAVINPDIFLREVEEAVEAGFDRRFIYLDSRAAIITSHHVAKEEKSLTQIGSTAQGVGEARCERVMRRGYMVRDIPVLRQYMVEDVGGMVRRVLGDESTVLYEMGQGFDLCMYHGVDPTYCTSRNNTPAAAFADMGVPVRWAGHVYAVIRTYPIRVNNRTGTSGPYPSLEIDWKTVTERSGAPEDLTEITTTTRLPRRVFEFSMPQYQRMIEICQPHYICLQFANYLDHGIFGETRVRGVKLTEFVRWLERNGHRKVAYIGTGPQHSQMIDRGIDEMF